MSRRQKPTANGKLRRLMRTRGPWEAGAQNLSDIAQATLEKMAFLGINAAMELAHRTAINAGWYRNLKTGRLVKRNFGEVVALMHSELSETLEADRKGLMDDKLPHRDGREVEFADTFIRIGDTAKAEHLNVAAAIMAVERVLREHSMAEVRFALGLFKMLAASADLGLDLAGAIIDKNRFNQKRADHKLEARKAGGKKY